MESGKSGSQPQRTNPFEVFIHNQNQAHKFLRTVITGIAVFGVSLGTGIISQWSKIEAGIPDFQNTVQKSWGVPQELVHVTNDLHLVLAGFILILGLFLLIDSARVAHQVLRTKPPEYCPKRESKDPPDFPEIVDFQYSCLSMAYDLAEWAFLTVSIGSVMGTIAIIGQADVLALLDLIFILALIFLSIQKTPAALMQIVEVMLLNSRFFEYKPEAPNIERHEYLRFYAPHFIVILATSSIILFSFMFAGLVGVIWLIEAFWEFIPINDELFDAILPAAPSLYWRSGVG